VASRSIGEAKLAVTRLEEKLHESVETHVKEEWGGGVPLKYTSAY